MVPRSTVGQLDLWVKQYIRDMLPVQPYLSIGPNFLSAGGVAKGEHEVLQLIGLAGNGMAPAQGRGMGRRGGVRGDFVGHGAVSTALRIYRSNSGSVQPGALRAFTRLQSANDPNAPVVDDRVVSEQDLNSEIELITQLRVIEQALADLPDSAGARRIRQRAGGPFRAAGRYQRFAA